MQTIARLTVLVCACALYLGTDPALAQTPSSLVSIVVKPSDSDVYNGATILATCVAYGANEQPQISWFKGDSSTPLSNDSTVIIYQDTITESSLTFSVSILELCGVTPLDDAVYHCQATNTDGTDKANFTLTVISREIQIVIAPENATVSEGNTIFMTCVSYGVPYSAITWRRAGVELVNSTRISIYSEAVTEQDLTFTQSILEICSTELSDGGMYECVVENGASNDSASFTLSVIPVRDAPQIVVAPEPLAVDTGLTVFITCVAYGELPTYITWVRESDQVALDNDTTRATVFEELITEGGLTFTQSILQICSMEEADESNYTCVAVNDFGNDTATFELSVNAPKEIQIVIAPENATVSEGNTIFLTCVSYGVPYSAITWRRAGVELVNSTRISIHSEAVIKQDLTFTQSILKICSTELSDGGMYECVAENGANNDSASITLTVIPVGVPLEITVGPQDLQVVVGDTAVFTCTAEADPIPTISWQFNDQPISNSSQYGISTSGDSTSTLTISNVQVADEGTYTCNATNDHHTDTATAQLTVITNPVMPMINETGGLTLSFTEGDAVSLVCIADGNPEPQIIWFKNEEYLLIDLYKGLVETTEMVQPGFRRGLDAVRSTLTFSSVTVEDSGSYMCRASNGIGSPAFLPNPYTLDVTRVPVDHCESIMCQNGGTCQSLEDTFFCACRSGFTGDMCEQEQAGTKPVIVQHPMSVTVDLYTEAVLDCKAEGSPQPLINWYKDGDELPGASGQSLTISRVEVPDRGVYHCVASNSEGSAESLKAIVNINNVHQYSGTLCILQTSDLYQELFGNMEIDLNDDDVSLFINELNQELLGMEGSVTIYSVTVPEGATVDEDGCVDVMVLVVVSEGVDDTTAQDEVVKTIEEGYCPGLNDIQRSDICPMENTTAPYVSVAFQWLESALGETHIIPCPCKVEVPFTATRQCGGSFTTGVFWEEVQSECVYSEVTEDLCSEPETEVVVELTDNSEILELMDIAVTMKILETHKEDVLGNETGTKHFYGIVDNLMQTDPGKLQASNISQSLMSLIDELADAYPTEGQIIETIFGVSIHNIDNSSFTGLTISVQVNSSGIQIIERNGYGLDDSQSLTQMSLPPSVFSGGNPQERVVTGVFVDDQVFVQRQPSVTQTVGSTIMTARVVGRDSVSLPQNPAKFFFLKNQGAQGQSTQCSFYDESRGTWSQAGCTRIAESNQATTCDCDHLTGFAIIVDTEADEVDDGIGPIVYLGGIVCILFLVITIILYLTGRTNIRISLHTTDIGISLINLCVAVIALYISYIISYYTTSSDGACIAFSAIFHYLFLVATIAFVLVSIFRLDEPSPYLRKKLFAVSICANWVLPILIVVASLAPDVDNYKSDDFCRPDNEPYWFGLILPWGVIHLLTLACLLIALRVHRHLVSKTDSSADYRPELKDHIGIILALVFFNIAWGVGLPSTHTLDLGSTRKILQIIFIITSFLLGLIVFIFFCLLSRDVRSSWKKAFSSVLHGKQSMHSPENTATLATNHMSRPVVKKVEAGLSNEEEGEKALSNIYVDSTEVGATFGATNNIYDDPMEIRAALGGDVSYFNEAAARKEAEAEEEEEVKL